MVSCCVESCNSTSITHKKINGITFHSFPRDPDRCAAWVRFVNRKEWQPNKYSRVCCKHFAAECFDMMSDSLVRLVPDAIPTLNQDNLYLKEEVYDMDSNFPMTKIKEEVYEKDEADNTAYIKVEPKDPDCEIIHDRLEFEKVEIKLEDVSSTPTMEYEGTEDSTEVYDTAPLTDEMGIKVQTDVEDYVTFHILKRIKVEPITEQEDGNLSTEPVEQVKLELVKLEEEDINMEDMVTAELTEDLDIKLDGLPAGEMGSAVNEKHRENGLRVGVGSAEVKSFVCYTCNYTAHSKKNLEMHIAARNCNLKTSKPANEYVCSLRDMEFASKLSLDNHVTKLHPKQTATRSRKLYECSICSYKTVSKSNFNRHRSVHSSGPKGFSCNYCNVTYRSKHRLNHHIIRKHLNKITSISDTVHECSACSFKTVQRSLLDEHVMSVHLDTPSNSTSFSCIHCNSNFKRKDSLEDHIVRKHPVHKASVTRVEHECSQCTYKTIRKCKLNAHVRSIHSEADASSSLKLNTCIHCNKSFRRKATLDDHVLKNHPDDIASVTHKVHGCPQCAYKTTKKSDLDSHIISTHPSAASSYKYSACEHCYAIFTKKQSLDDHIIRNHPDSIASVTSKIHTCSECSFKTARKCRLDGHFAWKHPEALRDKLGSTFNALSR